MSYTGFIRCLCRDYLSHFDYPKVLEIGVYKGQSAIPLIQNMSLNFKNFLYVGVDILIREELADTLAQFSDVSIKGIDEPYGRDVFLFENNSLEWLKNINLKETEKFNLVLVDGDHNYHTVYNELNLIKEIISPKSIIVCDDYKGEWGMKDMFYANKSEYKNNKIATRPVQTEKQGVESAVNDFIIENKGLWAGWNFSEFEPVFLYRKDIWKKIEMDMDSYCKNKILRNRKIRFELVDKE